MNRAEITGRLTRDPESRNTQSDIAICTFTVAVDRKFKNAAGEKQADFIPVVCFRKTAEFVQKYFSKGSRIEVCGSIQTRNWDDAEGKKHYTTEIIADEVGFGDSKIASGQAEPARTEPVQPVPGENDADGFSLPFDI